MTPAQYQRVSEIFLGAIRLDGAGREDYLRSACGSDLAVRDKVLAMLAEHDSPKVDLESPVIEASLQIDGLFAHLSTGESEPVPERLGSYQILEVLGKGGMGVVYRAQQQNPKRTVALKSIRHGLSSSKAIQRFALEAEALARLQHPGIAQIFEGVDVLIIRAEKQVVSRQVLNLTPVRLKILRLFTPSIQNCYLLEF